MTTSRIQPLLSYLYSLFRNDRVDRGALAALRRGAGERPGTVPEMFPLVEPRLPEDARQEESDAAYRVAALFALQHQGASRPIRFGDATESDRRQDRSFGAALQRAAKDDGQLNPGIERRFLALLDARREDIDPHLRSLLALMKARGPEIPIDFGQLYDDLVNWGRNDRAVQRRWAQDFWRGSAPSTDTTDSEPASESRDDD